MSVDIESNRQEGDHPLLLSLTAMAKLGIKLDMPRGQCELPHLGQWLNMYRVKQNGLFCVDASEWPFSSEEVNDNEVPKILRKLTRIVQGDSGQWYEDNGHILNKRIPQSQTSARSGGSSPP